GNGLEDEGGVLDGARHRAEFVEGPAQRHCAAAWNAAESRAKPSNAAAHGRADDAAAGFAADGKTNQACRGGGAGTCAGARGAFFEEPRIHGLAAEPNVVECERAKTELGDEDCASFVKAFDYSGVFFRNAIAEGFGAVSCSDSGSVEQVFSAPGNAMERAAIFSC